MLAWGVCPQFRAYERKSYAYTLSPLSLLLCRGNTRYRHVSWFFAAGYHPREHPSCITDGHEQYLTHVGVGAPYYYSRGRLLHVWPNVWRHWHCERATLALIVVRRYAAQRWMRALPRDVMQLVARAVMETRYEEQWEL